MSRYQPPPQQPQTARQPMRGPPPQQQQQQQQQYYQQEGYYDDGYYDNNYNPNQTYIQPQQQPRLPPQQQQPQGQFRQGGLQPQQHQPQYNSNYNNQPQYRQQPSQPPQPSQPQQQQQQQQQYQSDEYNDDEYYYEDDQSLMVPIPTPVVAPMIFTRAQKLEAKLSQIPSYQPTTDPFSTCKTRLLVAVRSRPLGAKEIKSGAKDIIKTPYSPDYSKPPIIGQPIEIHEGKVRLDMTPYTEIHKYNTDQIFGISATNEHLYQRMVQPLLHFAISGNGGRATCFAYGQTGSGKTYTMMGHEPSETPGLYSLAVIELFQFLPQHLTLSVTFFEIYGDKLFDLLANKAPLVAREDEKGNVNIIGVKEIEVTDPETVLTLISNCMKLRSQAATGANADSSRSHAVLQFIFRKKDDPNKKVTIDTNKSLSKTPSFSVALPFGKLSFIDLAGSERGGDTSGNNAQVRREGAAINKSLLALKECIRAIDQNSHHTPYRQNVLTQVLKDSLSGSDTRTSVIANISPSSQSAEDTINTLRYAIRIRETPVNKSIQRLLGGTTPNPSSSRLIGGGPAKTATKPALGINATMNKTITRPTAAPAQMNQTMNQSMYQQPPPQQPLPQRRPAPPQHPQHPQQPPQPPQADYEQYDQMNTTMTRPPPQQQRPRPMQPPSQQQQYYQQPPQQNQQYDYYNNNNSNYDDHNSMDGPNFQYEKDQNGQNNGNSTQYYQQNNTYTPSPPNVQLNGSVNTSLSNTPLPEPPMFDSTQQQQRKARLRESMVLDTPVAPQKNATKWNTGRQPSIQQNNSPNTHIDQSMGDFDEKDTYSSLQTQGLQPITKLAINTNPNNSNTFDPNFQQAPLTVPGRSPQHKRPQQQQQQPGSTTGAIKRRDGNMFDFNQSNQFDLNATTTEPTMCMSPQGPPRQQQPQQQPQHQQQPQQQPQPQPQPQLTRNQRQVPMRGQGNVMGSTPLDYDDGDDDDDDGDDDEIVQEMTSPRIPIQKSRQQRTQQQQQQQQFGNNRRSLPNNGNPNPQPSLEPKSSVNSAHIKNVQGQGLSRSDFDLMKQDEWLQHQMMGTEPHDCERCQDLSDCVCEAFHAKVKPFLQAFFNSARDVMTLYKQFENKDCTTKECSFQMLEAMKVHSRFLNDMALTLEGIQNNDLYDVINGDDGSEL